MRAESAFMFCPKCKQDRAHRSHRRGPIEYLASLVAYYPYRCRECHYRFLQFRYAQPELAGAGLSSTEREIRNTRAAIRWKRKRLELLLYSSGILLFLAFLYYITREGG